MNEQLFSDKISLCTNKTSCGKSVKTVMVQYVTVARLISLDFFKNIAKDGS